jgi:hypothetical protein
MNPGIYIFRAATPGGPAGFEYTGSGSLTGNGVMLFMREASSLNLSGSGRLTLTAMTAPGAFRGVLFHETPGLPVSNISLHRADGAVLRGLINLPSRNFNVSGSGSAILDEVNMVANKLTTSGNGRWSFRAAPPSSFQRGVVYLKS